MGLIVTKGVFKLQEILELQRKIVPELVEVLEKRYNVLRTIYYNQPIGRRMLASELDLGERVVRNEIDLLKSQNLIRIKSIIKCLPKSHDGSLKRALFILLIFHEIQGRKIDATKWGHLNSFNIAASDQKSFDVCNWHNRQFV